MLHLLLLNLVLLQDGQSGFPSITTKKELYASSDLRGKPAPKLVVEQWLTGEAPSTKGKIVIIDFWATWCGPCRATIPELNAIAKKFSNDVVVIGISDEKPSVVSQFMKETKMEYNVALDSKKHMESIVGVKGIPHVLVISPDGIVRWQGFPLDDAENLANARFRLEK